MDPENTVLKVSNWLKAVWAMRRNNPVQQWVESLPQSNKTEIVNTNQMESNIKTEPKLNSSPQVVINEGTSDKENIIEQENNMTLSVPISIPHTPAKSMNKLSTKLSRDASFQSDSSHCSSIESLLEARKPDPEVVLLNLGFGGSFKDSQEGASLSRIPKRFLQPSKLKGIDINKFVKEQQETTESLDSVSLGYRGLTGTPNVAPSKIVKKIMQCFRENESHEIDAYVPYCYNEDQHLFPYQQDGRLSVLSPDNRQFLERPRSKSPDMRNKRMIIGKKSFAFGKNGDLIEIFTSKKETEDEKEQLNINLEIEGPKLQGNENSSINTYQEINEKTNEVLSESEVNPIIPIIKEKNANNSRKLLRFQSLNTEVDDNHNLSKNSRESKSFLDSETDSNIISDDLKNKNIAHIKKPCLKRQARIDDESLENFKYDKIEFVKNDSCTSFENINSDNNAIHNCKCDKNCKNLKCVQELDKKILCSDKTKCECKNEGENPKNEQELTGINKMYQNVLSVRAEPEL